MQGQLNSFGKYPVLGYFIRSGDARSAVHHDLTKGKQMKRIAAVMVALLSASPAFAETTPWVGVSAGINVDSGGGSVAGRLGIDTTIGKGAFLGVGVGLGESGAKDCIGLACAYGGRDMSAELRLGGITKGGSKIYAIAGYSNLAVTIKSGAVTLLSYKDGGVTGGVGFEQSLGAKTFLRTEFRYTTYGGGDYVTSIMPTIGFKF